MKPWLSVLLAGSLALTLPTAGFAYSNPYTLTDSWVWNNGDFYGEGDPYILKFNGTYYLYVSTVDDKAGVKVWSSEDLVHWEYKGLCSTDPLTKGAYAPEVVYWNGFFYMYTSPAGHGHYVLRSSSPLGPFTVQTENKGMGIDGHVFVDDDGKWYFYSTGEGQIDARPMSDPLTFGERHDTGAEMKGWTEAPTVLKRDGKYVMTYVGNHVWSKGYRVNYGSSTSPLEGFVPPAGQNPILISTEGEHVGLGHNSVVRGPDLDSDYMVYHSHANPGRQLNLDRMAWNGGKMLVLGPTTSDQPDPELPDYSDRFRRSSLGSEWKTVGEGRWDIRNGESLRQDKTGSTKWYRGVTAKTSGPDYTAEFHMKQVKQGDSADPRFGTVFSYKNENHYGVAVLNPGKNRLETFFRVNGVDGAWQTSALPQGYDYTKWHQLRVEKAGADVRIYVDGMLKQTRSVQGLEGGSVGYTTSDTHAEFGYTAFSNKVNGSSAFSAYKPVPGRIEAVHYNPPGKQKNRGPDHEPGHGGKPEKNDASAYRGDGMDLALSSEGGYYIESFKAKDDVSYNVNVAETAAYDLELRYAAGKPSRLRIKLDGRTVLADRVSVPATGKEAPWNSLLVKGLQLPEGKHTLTVEALGGSFDFSSMTFHAAAETGVFSDDFNDGSDAGWTKYDLNWKVDTGETVTYNAYKPLPGIVEAPYYNDGGEGVGYHETSPENIGGALRGDAVDVRTNSFNGHNVGWNQTGEWLKYNVEVKEAGLYNFELSSATTMEGTQARLWLEDGTDLTGVMDLPISGDWNRWVTTKKEGIYLPEGRHTLKLETVKGEYDFARLEFTSYEVHKPLPGVIEAAHFNSGGEGTGYHDTTPENSGGVYRAGEGVDLRASSQEGWSVSGTESGEWLKYNVEVPEAGTYQVGVRTAAEAGGGRIRLWLDDARELTGVIDIPAAGGKDTWSTVDLGDIQLPAGKHKLKVEIVQGGFELSRIAVGRFAPAAPLPGTVYAAYYQSGGEGIGYHDTTPQNIGQQYRSDGVDIRMHPDGGFTTGWNQTGEWLKYRVDVAEAGPYNLDLRTATSMDGGQVRLWLDDATDLTGIIDVPSTGSFDLWTTLTRDGIELPAGEHTIKVEIVKGEFDFYSFRFHRDPVIPKEGVYKAEAGGFAKSVTGSSAWSDYTVETDIRMTAGSEAGNAGILVRVNNPATGNDWGQRNPDFLQGYMAYLTADGVHLGKFNYDFEHLAGAPMSGTTDTWHHMKVVAKGANIKIYVGDMDHPKLDYTDQSPTAFSHGKVGVRSLSAETLVDNFKVSSSGSTAAAVESD
ncbi:carbohydrate-binding protein [Paenibacillus sp. S-38]|uniref:carbohydrate-binding protein n=1 Tax=Paenibacillus sp. S-38 TaxID=3416710 RepID=UPI003CF07B8C